MIDRAIGIAGLALAVIFGAWSLAPEGWPKMPSWASLIGVGTGILLIGVAIGLIAGQRRDVRPSDEPSIIETGLFLQFTGGSSIPIAKYTKNVRFWYALYTASVTVDTKDKDGKSLGGFSIPPQWAIFIIFDKPPIIRQLISTCDGPSKPKCDVSTANSVYAIVTMSGDVTKTTLDISVTQ
jgi:hypothetical protein